MVGIDNIALYVPRQRIPLERLVKHRAENKPALQRALGLAIRNTGQQSIRFPYPWEDTATMGAEAARQLLAHPDGSVETANHTSRSLRYLAVGTESGLDHAKALASYTEGMLQRSGIAIPPTISTFQVQQACAGGSIALVSIAALLEISAAQEGSGLIICSDIAHYKAGSAAEITQGAGAAALLVSKQPRLIELDLSVLGQASQDVDDFFRPLGTISARVKGRYSVECYHEALRIAFADYCQSLQRPPQELLQEIELFVLHNPFRNMAERALRTLLRQDGGLSPPEIERYLSERGFATAVAPTAKIGNIYSGSLYLSLAFLLKERWRHWGDDIIGKRILMCSYGSGNTMLLISGRVANAAPTLLAEWEIDHIYNDYVDATMEQYQQWMESPFGLPLAAPPPSDISNNHYYLSAIRNDGYREYRHK